MDIQKIQSIALLIVLKNIWPRVAEEKFFAPLSVGRPTKLHQNELDQLIISLRI